MVRTTTLSNHPRGTFSGLHFGDLPFHHFLITKDTNTGRESAIRKRVEQTGTDLVVPARYMRIVSGEISTKLAGRYIDIHHLFLPGLKGARLYHQAHGLGFKLIGATAHHFTSDRGEGKNQDVECIGHRDSPDVLVRKGCDIAFQVLARAIRYHADDRIILNGRKTVVFVD